MQCHRPVSHLPSPPQVNLPEASREALIEQLRRAIDRFESTSLPLATTLRESLLWFQPGEFKEVNEMLRAEGIEAVLARWGVERTYASGAPGRVSGRIFKKDEKIPAGSLILLVSEFAVTELPDPEQNNYFRSSSFSVPPQLQSELITTLTKIGLLSKILPCFDEATKKHLAPSQITQARCISEWYGPTNIYGDGALLKIILDLSSEKSEKDEISLQLTLQKDGTIYRSLWDGSLAETGYEGHNHLSISATTDELRALLPLIDRVAELHPESPQPSRMGAWIGNYFGPSITEPTDIIG